MPLRHLVRLPRIAAAAVALAALAGTSLVATAGLGHAAPGVVGTAPTPDGTGWWTVDAAGDVTAGGSAAAYGGLGGVRLNRPIVGIASTTDGAGYWLVASDGGIFTFGDARFLGSTGNLRLNQPVVGMAATPDGAGYWMVAADGGIFSFGDAAFHGSTGGVHLRQPIVGMTPTADGAGYWLVASDGGIFTFGDARFFGSTGSLHLSAPIVGMASTHDRGGYWLAGADGAAYSFGDAAYAGGAPGSRALGVIATPGGGYTLLTTAGPVHEGAPVAGTWAQPARVPAAPSVSAPNVTGRTSTIGTATTPQVVRVGASLRELDPSDPGQYLPGNFKFAGVDAYEATTSWPDQNNGCGYSLPDAQRLALFRGLGPDAVVRTWFFQAMDRNQYSGAINWAPFDRVVQEADATGVHLVATLGNQDGTCDDGVWKDPGWYSAGFQAVPAGRSLSYEQWVELITQRYAGNPAILAWEPVNEPRPDTCTNASNCWPNRTCIGDQVANSALRHFYDVIGADIRRSDPNHLISDGAPPVAGCGTLTWADMQQIEASPGIDLMSFHDYNGLGAFSAADVANWSALSAAVGKPLFAGENGGVNATADTAPSASCPGQTARASGFATKAADQFARMPFFTGWLFWNALPDTFNSCDYATWLGDPLLAGLANAAAHARAAS